MFLANEHIEINVVSNHRFKDKNTSLHIFDIPHTMSRKFGYADDLAFASRSKTIEDLAISDISLTG